MKMCRSATTKDEKAKHYIDILLSSVEYETFIKLMHIMRPVAEKRLSMAESKEGSCNLYSRGVYMYIVMCVVMYVEICVCVGT